MCVCEREGKGVRERARVCGREGEGGCEGESGPHAAPRSPWRRCFSKSIPTQICQLIRYLSHSEG